jgi:hypothetical protein
LWKCPSTPEIHTPAGQSDSQTTYKRPHTTKKKTMIHEYSNVTPQFNPL